MGKKFKVTGSLAHTSKSKKTIDFTEIITAPDLITAYNIYKRKLRGVKKNKIIEVKEV